LRTSPEEQIPEDVFVVFNAQQAHGTLPVDDRACPADAGLLDMTGACELCRQCISPSMLPPAR
jgi:hypothetical protein